MGFLSKRLLSWKKFSTVRKLERTMAPPNERVHDVVADLMSVLLRGGPGEKQEAFEQFLAVCEAEMGVRAVLKRERLTRQDLKNIVLFLLGAGLGEWINGHYVALSTIAYAEPLQYVIGAERQGVSSRHMFFCLLEYWQRRMTAAQLLDSLPQEFSTATVTPKRYSPSTLSVQPAHE